MPVQRNICDAVEYGYVSIARCVDGIIISEHIAVFTPLHEHGMAQFIEDVILNKAIGCMRGYGNAIAVSAIAKIKRVIKVTIAHCAVGAHGKVYMAAHGLNTAHAFK